MSEQTITAIRWVLLVCAVLNLLQASVGIGLTRWMMRRIGVERSTDPAARLLASPLFQRGWPILMAIVFLAGWWWLGTPAGHASARQFRLQ
jgi:hypothetical protein